MEDSRTRVVIYYAIWATICAAVAGIVIALIHTAFFSYHPTRSAFMETLFGGIVAAVAIAAGQGAVALVTGGVLARFGRTPAIHGLAGFADWGVRFRDVFRADGSAGDRARVDPGSHHSRRCDGTHHRRRVAQSGRGRSKARSRGLIRYA
jgi:hypothetical protein